MSNQTTQIKSSPKVKSKDWLFSLSVDDKLDIFDDRYPSGWYIGTVIAIQNRTICAILTIRYDAWGDGDDESICIIRSESQSKKLKKLHSITAYHDYLTNENAPSCGYYYSSEDHCKKCETCQRRCCVSCLIDTDSDICIHCITKQETINCKTCKTCQRRCCVSCNACLINGSDICTHCGSKQKPINNDWIFSMSVNDKLDICAQQYNAWYIGTVIDYGCWYSWKDRGYGKWNYIPYKALTIRYYDENGVEHHESISVRHSQLISKKLKQLNSVTAYHSELNNGFEQQCRNHTSFTCDTCQRQCCRACLISTVFHTCKDCIANMKFEPVMNALCSSTNNKYDIDNMDINIIYCIIEYMGIVVTCASTEMYNCTNVMICTGVRTGLRLGYQYTPDVMYPGTIKLYGQNIRIFCRQCTSTDKRLIKCKFCNNRESGINVCHNHKHKLLSFNICKQDHREPTKLVYCNCCRKTHCLYCIHDEDMKYYKCKECGLGGYKCWWSYTKCSTVCCKDLCVKCNDKYIIKCGTTILGNEMDALRSQNNLDFEVNQDLIMNKRMPHRNRRIDRYALNKQRRNIEKNKAYWKRKLDKRQNKRSKQKWNKQYLLSLGF